MLTPGMLEITRHHLSPSVVRSINTQCRFNTCLDKALAKHHRSHTHQICATPGLRVHITRISRLFDTALFSYAIGFSGSHNKLASKTLMSSPPSTSRHPLLVLGETLESSAHERTGKTNSLRLHQRYCKKSGCLAIPPLPKLSHVTVSSLLAAASRHPDYLPLICRWFMSRAIDRSSTHSRPGSRASYAGTAGRCSPPGLIKPLLSGAEFGRTGR
ncbi:hypothetical protein RRG08_020670 [Elysia crispata]|uniref:Uncharacterized protein n=1 Tax=Elysia crispata TaxID=231223 RepID=A0AAE0Z5D3_9GAST|nr:hypothetical protein RRG08_020670 [Elysia crispata]